MDLVRINEEVITAEGLIKHLKLTGQFDTLIEDVVREKLTVHVARKTGVRVSIDEVQARADQIRRVRGLHRAVDMNRWLDQLGITLDDLETFITDTLYFERMQDQMVTEAQIEEYFSLNLPRFDSLIVSHILVDTLGKAREIVALLEDDPDCFDALAREHSLADTAGDGGYVGMITRGSLSPDIEARVFHAQPGDVLGPFATPDESGFEIFTINDKRSATLDDDTRAEIRRLLKDEWFAARAKENRIELC